MGRSAACNVFARCAQVEEGTVPLAELKRQSLESAQGVFASDKERTDGDMIKHALGLRERQDSERFLAEGRDSAASMTLEQFVSFLKNKAQAAAMPVWMWRSSGHWCIKVRSFQYSWRRTPWPVSWGQPLTGPVLKRRTTTISGTPGIASLAFHGDTQAPPALFFSLTSKMC